MSSEIDPATRSHLDIFMKHRAILAEKFPDWFQEFEDVDPFVADRQVVEALVLEAPTEFASGVLCGILMFRQQLAAVTGREF